MPPTKLVEGEDYVVENGLFVFTAGYLRRRGHCCQSGCRHCPYGYTKEDEDADLAEEPLPISS
jgi:hypothetical protein